MSLVRLGEEDAVAQVNELSRNRCLPALIGGEGETMGIGRRPLDSRMCLEEEPRDMQRIVTDMTMARHSMPANRKRGGRAQGAAVVERVGDVEEIAGAQPFHMERGSARAEVDRHAVVRDPNRPEETARIRMNADVEVMDLRREFLKVKLTFVDIQSNKAECAAMNPPV